MWLIYKIILPAGMIVFLLGCPGPNQPDKEIGPDLLYERELGMARDSIDTFLSIIPIDESANHPELLTFINELKHAVDIQDTSYIYSILSDSIHLSFGGHFGINDFKDMWHIENQYSGFWDKFEEAICLGGFFSDDSSNYTFPYMFTHVPSGYSPYDIVVGTSDSTRVFYHRNESTVFDTASFTIFELIHSENSYEANGETFLPIKITEDKFAYVASSEVRSPNSYRGSVKEKGGEWELVFWIAGD